MRFLNWAPTQEFFAHKCVSVVLRFHQKQMSNTNEWNIIFLIHKALFFLQFRCYTCHCYYAVVISQGYNFKNQCHFSLDSFLRYICHDKIFLKCSEVLTSIGYYSYFQIATSSLISFHSSAFTGRWNRWQSLPHISSSKLAYDITPT